MRDSSSPCRFIHRNSFSNRRSRNGVFSCSRAILLYILVLQYCLFVFFKGSSGSEKQEIAPKKLKILQPTHTFIHSTYYYPYSKSLGANAVAIVTTMNKRTVSSILDYTVKVVGTNGTMRIAKQATLTTEHVIDDRCDYSLFLIQTNLIDNIETLEIEADGVFIKLPFKNPIVIAPKPVVFCVSPQFVAEQWQSFLVHVHIAKRYGAHLHIYIVSMIESYFKLLKEYEKLELISIEPWLTMKFPVTDGPYLDPNRNVELRNQAAAHTDCILMYKESTSFIGILDLDDILIPRNANSYYEEFEREYHGDWTFSAIQYRKYDYKTVKVANLKDQSISAMIKNSKLMMTMDEGKSFIRPERYNSTWSHFSRNADKHPVHFKELGKSVKMHRQVMENNAIYHLKVMEMKNPVEFETEAPIPKLAVNFEERMINETHLEEIERDMKRTISLPSIAQLEPFLPREDFYMNIVFKCYNESFYYLRDRHQLHHAVFCVNAYSCELPQRANLPCVHSDAKYHSGPKMWPITYHYATDAFFSNEIGCYQ